MFTDVLVNLSLCALSLILTYVIVVSSKVMFLVIFMQLLTVVVSSVLTCWVFYYFCFVYILYSTAVIWRINFIIIVFFRLQTALQNSIIRPLSGR